MMRMQVTRRWWASVGLAGLLGIAAVVFARPILVAGAAGLGSWLLIQQWLFTRTVTQLAAELRITQTVEQTRIVVDEAVTGSLTVERPDRSRIPVEVTIDAGVPLGAAEITESARRCTLPGEQREATTSFTVQWPVAGRVEFTAPTVTVRDDHGLFRTTFAGHAPDSPTVTVRPQRPRALHVGTGGTPTADVFGEHPGDEQTSGLEPEMVREYMPGDPLRNIDWKATARSDDLYVRTFTERTERETAMFIDHRAAMATGTPGETKLAYAQQVALAVAGQAQEDSDPVGLYAVGNDGVTVRQPPNAAIGTYATLRAAIHDLTPTDSPRPASDPRASPTAEPPPSRPAQAKPDELAGRTPSDARRSATALSRENSSFATRLRPFYMARRTYIQRIAAKPLYTTVRAYLTTGGGTNHDLSPNRTVVLTDDTNRAEVREAVNVARRHSDHVFVFMTPTVLFEPVGIADLDGAYDQYTDFEGFRQKLARLDRVSAFEVAPGDRITTLQTTSPATASRGE
jgi:uncharacterized protein (DUF58 family)